MDKQQTFRIVLLYTVPRGRWSKPEDWDWNTMLDVAEDEHVTVLDVFEEPPEEE